MSARTSITERALSILSGGPKAGAGYPGGKLPLITNPGNRNLRLMLQKSNIDFFSQGSADL